MDNNTALFLAILSMDAYPAPASILETHGL